MSRLTLGKQTGLSPNMDAPQTDGLPNGAASHPFSVHDLTDLLASGSMVGGGLVMRLSSVVDVSGGSVATCRVGSRVVCGIVSVVVRGGVAFSVVAAGLGSRVVVGIVSVIVRGGVAFSVVVAGSGVVGRAWVLVASAQHRTLGALEAAL